MILGLSEAHAAHLAALWPQVPGLEGVVVFGSRARGDHRPASDLDLALLGPLAWRQQMDLALRLDELELPFEVELVRWSALKDPAMRASILREGRSLWGRSLEAPA